MILDVLKNIYLSFFKKYDEENINLIIDHVRETIKQRDNVYCERCTNGCDFFKGTPIDLLMRHFVIAKEVVDLYPQDFDFHTIRYITERAIIDNLDELKEKCHKNILLDIDRIKKECDLFHEQTDQLYDWSPL